MISARPWDPRYNDNMRERVRWLLSRPRALFRAWSVLGLWTTLQLVRIRLGSGRDSTHTLHIRNYPHPITIRGGKSTDAWAVYELIVMQEYALVGDLVPPNFIIDAGANIGVGSLYFLNRYPKARIVSIEPHPGNFELLAKNLAPYADRAILLQGAVWKNNDRLDLNFGEEEWRTSVKASDQKRPGTVEAFTLPAILAYGNGKAGLLKMDIEGSELEVFASDAQQWLPAIENIVIEVHSKQCSDSFWGAMKGYQYDVVTHHKDNVIVCKNLRAPIADHSVAPAQR